MKIKSLLCISLIFILVFIIYLTTLDREIYYLNISIDKNEYSYETYVKEYIEKEKKLEKYVNDFASSDDRVTDIIYAIKENKTITINEKKQTIKNALIKADLVTLFIGLNDINYKVGYSSINELYDYADSFLDDMNELLELVREYCKEDIVLIGYYNAYGSYYDEYFNYINREVENLAKEYNIKFITAHEIYNIDNHIESIWMDEEEHKILAQNIIEFIDEKILKKWFDKSLYFSIYWN